MQTRRISLAVLTTACAATLVFVTTDTSLPSEAGTPAIASGSAVAAPLQTAVHRQGLTARPRAEDGFYHAPVGSRFVFTGHSTTASEIRQKDVTNKVVYSLQTGMVWTVVGRRPGELLVELRCADAVVRLAAEGGPAGDGAAIASQLESPVTVRMQTDGKLLGLRFPDSMDLPARGFCRALACALQQQVQAADTYEVDEVDTTGAARVRYRWDVRPAAGADGVLHKQKLGYARLGAGNARLAATVEGSSRARMSADLGFVVAAEAEETVVVPLRELEAEVHTTLSWQFRLERHEGAAQLSAADWDSPFAPVRGDGDAAQSGARSERERQARRLAGVDIEQLAEDLLRFVAQGDRRSLDAFAAFDDLVWKLRLEPGLVHRLDAFVQAGDDDARSALLDAVGASDTPAAEDYLTAHLAADRAAGLQRAAARSLFQIRKPRRSTLRALDAAIRRPGTDAGVASTSLLVLGALSRGGDDPATRDGIDSLLALERTAAAHGQLSSWLEALGNSRSNKALPAARRYLGDADPGLRIAAAHSLRGIAEPTAVAALQQRLTVEQNHAVRQALLDSLVEQGSAPALTTLAGVLASDTDRSLRAFVLRALARRPGPGAGALLRRAATGDRDAELRALATRLLGERS